MECTGAGVPLLTDGIVDVFIACDGMRLTPGDGTVDCVGVRLLEAAGNVCEGLDLASGGGTVGRNGVPLFGAGNVLAAAAATTKEDPPLTFGPFGAETTGARGGVGSVGAGGWIVGCGGGRCGGTIGLDGAGADAGAGAGTVAGAGAGTVAGAGAGTVAGAGGAGGIVGVCARIVGWGRDALSGSPLDAGTFP